MGGSVMFFREHLVLRELGLEPGQVLTLKGKHPPPVELEIHPAEVGEIPNLKPGDCICTVRAEEPVSDNIAAQFASATEAAKMHPGTAEAGRPPPPPKAPQAVADIAVRVG